MSLSQQAQWQRRRAQAAPAGCVTSAEHVG